MISQSRLERVVLATVILCLTLGALPAKAGVKPAGPDALADTRSLGDAIRTSTEARPVHIIFVHGIRAEGRGSAAVFVKSLCRQMGKICLDVARPPAGPPTRLPIGDWPKDATQAGRQIWGSESEWEASRPFVDRYELTLTRGRKLVVDEVNWWPLLFPLKCRFLVEEDRRLSGLDKDDDALCRNAPKKGLRDPSKFDWLANYAPSNVKQARGQYWLNQSLKHGILNWGLSDAVIALGPMRAYTRAGMREAFKAASKVGLIEPEGQNIILVTESLGSFVVLDALRSEPEDSALSRIVGQSADLYFFANQFALLEMGRIENVAPSTDAGSPKTPSPRAGGEGLLQYWATSGRSDMPKKQIIAFSDPNDALTFLVPSIRGVTVVNVYDHNWGLQVPLIITNPATAHTGHSTNKAVLRLMLERVQ